MKDADLPYESFSFEAGPHRAIITSRHFFFTGYAYINLDEIVSLFWRKKNCLITFKNGREDVLGEQTGKDVLHALKLYRGSNA